MPEPVYKLGAKKDPVDKRDYKITRMIPAQVAVLPVSIDYTSKMSPVGNQFSEGTCVAFAAVDGMKEYQEKKEWSKYEDLSVRYVYQGCKKIDGIPDEEGTYPRCAMKVLTDNGVCFESCWPYIPNMIGSPCADAERQAASFKAAGYWRVEDVQAMKETLVANGPFVAAVLVYNGMFNAPGGVVPEPAEGENYVGGHAVCVVGYDDVKQRFKFKNSWGSTWGEGGYGYLSYKYMTDQLMDAWSARDKLGDPTPPKPHWYDWIVNFFRQLFGWGRKP